MAELPADVLDLERPSEAAAAPEPLPPFDNEASWQGISATTRAIVEFDAAREAINGYLTTATAGLYLLDRHRARPELTEAARSEFEYCEHSLVLLRNLFLTRRQSMKGVKEDYLGFMSETVETGKKIVRLRAKLNELISLNPIHPAIAY